MSLKVILSLCTAFMALLSCNDGNRSGLSEIETKAITEITSTSAVTGGNVLSAGDSEITEKGVCWNVNPDPEISDFLTTNGPGASEFTSSLTGLESETTYHVRAYATNDQGTAYGDDKSFETLSGGTSGQIIADHTVVKRYDNIPQQYINEVKKMLFVIAGESHSGGYTIGLTELEASNPAYAVNLSNNPPESYSNSYLRATRTMWGDLNNATGWIPYNYGEEDWFTSAGAIAQTKTGITYYNTNNLIVAAMGFGWCYDGSITDATDYLAATQSYISYCAANSYSTKIFFTTGPVDASNSYGETGYLKSLLYDEIRTYVKADASRILFDYADILCYDDNGQRNDTTWNGHVYPIITHTNVYPDGTGHISAAGRIRLAKAVWWMLARIAGWNGVD